MSQVRAKIAGQEYELDRVQIERELRDELPEPLSAHFVVVRGRRFPPKQVIECVTGLDRAVFNSHQARRILSRLGFTVGRRSHRQAPSAIGSTDPGKGQEADLLRPFSGRWVAQRGLEVLVAADTPQAVLGWLERHNQQADVMFKVPEDETEAAGASPV